MRLSDLPLPDGAEDRTLQVVREAFAARIPNPRRRTIRRSLPVVVVAAVAALAISTVAVRASGGSVLDTVRDALGVRNAAAVLTRLPTTGRLLVNSSNGPWIVSPDGAKRHLGVSYTQARWSPHGLFEVVVLRGRELAAIDPKGNLRWSLTRPAISGARWSGDGYRIAYRSGSTLRVVAGDGTGDHLVARGTAAAAPAWDGATHQLAYADRTGRIHLVNADTGRAVWISKRGPLPTQIAWEPGLREIVVVGEPRRACSPRAQRQPLHGDPTRPGASSARGLAGRPRGDHEPQRGGAECNPPFPPRAPVALAPRGRSSMVRAGSTALPGHRTVSGSSRRGRTPTSGSSSSWRPRAARWSGCKPSSSIAPGFGSRTTPLTSGVVLSAPRSPAPN